MPVQYSGNLRSGSSIGERVSMRIMRQELLVLWSEALTMRAVGWRAGTGVISVCCGGFV